MRKKWARVNNHILQDGTALPISRYCHAIGHPHMLRSLAQSGVGHFVTFYTCKNYWSILDPLLESMPPPHCMKTKMHRALRESFNSRNIHIPALPPHRQLPRNAVQKDAPIFPWSCGTFAMSTTSHLLLGGRPPHLLPAQYITRDHMMPLHRALFK